MDRQDFWNVEIYLKVVNRLITDYITYTLAKNEVPDMYIEEEIGFKN